MRISELAKQTGVRKETIHYYTREGFLPKPRKTSRNQAEYNEEHVERIKFIKELQDRFFLPLSTIKKIIREQKKSPANQPLLKLKAKYFHPLHQFFPEEVEGEESFLKATGMSAERLADFEKWRIIDPVKKNGRKIYSHDDLKTGKVIGDMRRIGLSYEKGFHREFLREIRDKFQEIVVQIGEEFVYGTLGKMTYDEMEKLSVACVEMTAIFFYHLHHRLCREELERRIELIKAEAAEQA